MTEGILSNSLHTLLCIEYMGWYFLGLAKQGFFHFQEPFALTKCIFLDLQVPEHSRIQIQFKIYPTEYGTLLVLR